MKFDENVLQRLLIEDDELAFRYIFDHFRNRIFMLSCKILKDEDLAEDALQDVLVKLWLKRKDLAKVQNTQAYITVVTRNCLYNYLKKLAHTELFIRLSETNDNVGQSEQVGLEYMELNKSLARAIQNLTPQQRKVYKLGKEEDLKYEEIAKQLNVSKETVKSHMADAIHSIRTYLIKNENVINLTLLGFLVKEKFL